MQFENFARPESMLDYGPEIGGIAELEAAELENSRFCEECGSRHEGDGDFCSPACEVDAHTDDCDCDTALNDEDFDRPEFEDDGQPSEYEEWQDLYGGDDWDHGQYDQFE